MRSARMNHAAARATHTFALFGRMLFRITLLRGVGRGGSSRGGHSLQVDVHKNTRIAVRRHFAL